MKAHVENAAGVDKSVESLRVELQRYHRELDECRKRMEQMEGLFAHVADAIFVAEPDGRIIDVNPAACELLGYSQEELLALHPWDFVTSASREEILSLSRNMSQGVPVTVQRTYRRKNGEQKIMDLRLTRCDLVGRDLIIVSCRDVTEQKRLQDRLRRSEMNLAEGQRLTKTGSWILDFKTGETDWSVETCRIFGFPDPPPSPPYSEFRARVRPEDRDGVDQGLRESFETGEPRPLKYLFILPNGVRKHIETISQPVRDDSGTVVRLMGTVMDMTERVKAEEALRASEKFARGQAEALRQTLDALARESSPDRIVEHVLRTMTRQLDAHSSSVWLRDEASGLMVFEFALEEGKFRTKSDSTIAAISPSLKIEEVWPWPEIFRTGKPYVLEDIRTGPDFPWRAHVLSQGVVTILIVPMLIAGKVAGVIGLRFSQKRAFRTEETELAQALSNQAMLAMQLTRLSEQSRQSAVMAERNRLARDIHDTLAQGFTGVIVQLEAAADATSKGLAKEGEEHLDRAGDLARESLREARRSVQALRPQVLEENNLCVALEGLFKKMTAGTPVQAEFISQGEPRKLPPDWEENLLRIGQEVLTNVLRHAQASHFSARLEFDSSEIRLELRDNGRGFDPAGKYDGFGLIGMKERVEDMGGQLSIHSAVGTGTAIEIVLPLTHQAPSLKP